MRVRRVPAVQAHYVPDMAYRTDTIFDASVLARPTVVDDYVPEPDGGGDPVPVDGTAQNGFTAVRWFRCRDCGGVLREAEIPEHHCEEEVDGQEEGGPAG